MKASVVRVPQSGVHVFIACIRNNEACRVPRHLKRVNKIGDGSALVLYGIGELSGFIVVDVPADYPASRDEHAVYNKIWPCYYHPVREEKVDEEYVSSCYTRMLIEMRGSKADREVQAGREDCGTGCRAVQGDAHEKSDTSVDHGGAGAKDCTRPASQPAKDGGTACACICLIANPANRRILAVERDRDDILNHGILSAVTAVSQLQIDYLCTGLDAFVLNEPCLSYSMAFVHGRIRRVFYVHDGTGTYSKLRIHGFKGFNHRYAVYKLSE